MGQTSSLQEDGTFESQKTVFNYFKVNVLNGSLDTLN